MVEMQGMLFSDLGLWGFRASGLRFEDLGYGVSGLGLRA